MGGLRAYIYFPSLYILPDQGLVEMGVYKPVFIQPILTHTTKFKKI